MHLVNSIWNLEFLCMRMLNFISIELSVISSNYIHLLIFVMYLIPEANKLRLIQDTFSNTQHLHSKFKNH